MRTTRAWAVAALAVALLLAACSSSSPATTGASVGGLPTSAAATTGAAASQGVPFGTGSVDVCALITSNPALSGAIQQILGTQGTMAPTPGSGGLSGCTVTGNSTGKGSIIVLTVDKRPEAAAAFNAFKTQPGATPVAGIGDDAFTITQDFGNLILSVLKGNVVVGASVPKTIAGGFASQLDAAKSLAASLLTSLGLT